MDHLLTINKYSRPGRLLSAVRGIVIHYVGVAMQRPEQTRKYFEELRHGATGIYASAHYIVGIEGNIIQCIPDNEVAYHCGANAYLSDIPKRLGLYPNNTTIGIELCHSDIGFSNKTLESAAELTATLVKNNGLHISDIYRHYDITGKNCPKFFVEDPKKWDAFLELVNKWL